MIPIKKIIYIIICILTSYFCNAQSTLRLWYEQPAKQWEETLPLGNGRLGMTPNGGVEEEKIVLNDITLWSGSSYDANNHEAYKSLPEIRKLILEGQNNEAQALVNKKFVSAGKGSGDPRYGCYQMLGTLNINFDYKNTDSTLLDYKNYKRSLSLNDAIATCSYQINGITYKREYFTSFDDDLDVIRLTTSVPGMLSCNISLDRPERSHTFTKDSVLEMFGQLDNGTDGEGMKYVTKVKVRVRGGSLQVGERALKIKNATEALIFISAGTDFRDSNFEKQIDRILHSAIHRPYAEQKSNHIANYKDLFNRVSLQLGESTVDSLPTDQRLERFSKNPSSDNDLAALFFQYGRYLSMSSTRPDLLPPNLQGLWANQIHTPWNGDYHLDVNVQMDNWQNHVCNLTELDMPLVKLVEGLVKPGERTARAYFDTTGWVAFVITNIWGYTAPGESASWGIPLSGSGWLCDNLWQHYAFTKDKGYLKRIYPVLKGAALFYNNILIRNPETGWLVTSPSSSPENAFYLPNGKTASVCMGPTVDNQIVRELFNNVITASELLGKDDDFKKKLKSKLKQMPPVGQVGKDGSLMEWLRDYEQTDAEHRHIAHLFGLYPASQITPEQTPVLAEASRKTLNTRGDDGPGWSIAYKMLWWARLHDGERAYKLFKNLMRPTHSSNINYGAGGGVYPNLLSAGPPFQIDGNFGGTAGIAEMLIQSHSGLIQFLPALPEQWENGSFSGLRVRGGGIVDAQWEDGALVKAGLHATVDNSFRVKLPSGSEKYSISIDNKPVVLHSNQGVLTLRLNKGEAADITFE